MVKRRFWHARLEQAWRERRVVWLAGVRRAGKTCLCQSLDTVEYFDCELPRVRRLLEDPESFLDSIRGKRVILDEIHRLQDPTEVLKIAADHYPDTRVIATGSSTLAASTKFRDSLTGRKRDLILSPLILADLEDFGRTDLSHRLLRGGLPPMFLADALPERDFQEWLDGYWAKDIQELFRLERRASFLRFCELVLAQSGGIFEATRFTRPCEVSRPTIANYLSVLEATLVATVVRPFSSRSTAEIIAAPKVYGFDTGFVCAFRGWTELRREDLGQLWEHLVLNELRASLQSEPIQYWRDKVGHEVDFVIARRGRPPVAIECKWSANGFDPRGLGAFRRRYPEGENLLVAADVERAQTRRFGELAVRFISLSGVAELGARGRR
jgi:predicted AAA+ superfamily ATPase